MDSNALERDEWVKEAEERESVIEARNLLI